MKEKFIEGKLDTKPVPARVTETSTTKNLASQTARPRSKIKFTDYSIERFTSDFIDPITNKTRYRVYSKFDVSKNTKLKGLRLCQFEKTKSKHFILRYWFNGQYLSLTLGEFKPGKFGVRECEQKLYEIAKTHQNDKGIWTQDPKQTIKDKENKIAKAIIVESQKLTINQVVERLCKDNFPKSKKQGRLTAHSIRGMCLYLIGYNWRSKHLIYVDNDKGHGSVHFKSNFQRRTAKPEDWSALFKKFPAGHGIIKDKKFNPNNERSVFDSDLGKMVIEDLTHGIVKRYIDKKHRSYGTKKNMLDTFRKIWNYARDIGLMGDEPPRNPCTEISFLKPDTPQSTSSQYNHKRFNEENLKLIYDSCLSLSEKYPFQAEAILLLIFTGRRIQETLKIKRSYIKYSEGVIVLPANITKGRKEEFIDITPPVQFALEQIDKQIQGKWKKYQFVDWLFPSVIRIDSRKLHDDQYVRSNQTRLKSVNGCWKAIEEKTGIHGSPKLFRKTFSSIAKIVLGTTSKARALTGHEQDSTLDIHYDKTERSKAKEYAHQVAEVFNFVKKTG